MMRPGRSSISSTSKTMACDAAGVDAEQISDEQLGVVAAFCGSNLDNHLVILALRWFESYLTSAMLYNPSYFLGVML